MSGELQRLSTNAELMPLMRTNHGLVLSREGKQLQARLRQVAADGHVQKGEIAVATEITMDAMDSTATVDNHRRTLAGEDAALNSALVQLELNHLNHLSRIQRGSGF